VTTTFYLGTHQPAWLARAGVPLFLSAIRLRPRKTFPRAAAPWALDSGAFSDLAGGHPRVPARQYAAEARRFSAEIGSMEWAAIQDWMCEGMILAKTGLTVTRHQELTVASWVELNATAPDVPWVPVLQGYKLREYVACVEMYRRAGTDLTRLPTVGVGSVCKRQAMGEAEDIVRELSAMGLRLHGFGFKVAGLARVGRLLASADSLAWSDGARRKKAKLPGCTHAVCNNCMTYALAWRQRVAASLARPLQMTLV
jgi:hypothetical protein